MVNKQHIRSTAVGTTLGFYLWRGGLLFSAAWLAWEGFERGWRLFIAIGVPVQITAGVLLFVLGAVLLLASLIVERIFDARAERGLKDQ